MLLTCSNRAGGVAGGLRAPALHQRACRGLPFDGTPYRAGPTRAVPCRVARGSPKGEDAAMSERARFRQLAVQRALNGYPWWYRLVHPSGAGGSAFMDHPILFGSGYVAGIVFFIDLYSTFGPMASVVIIPGVYMGVRHILYSFF
ncbi:hypothetical protein D9Q98_000034 [Chlorella vulgaris]|uniref:Uncharacterized protein n=1 Tax=Chlorella vulgaris TaxID=3077 RepID=A0A9D4TYJ6_CHLVU|nr:hypothetical protein D9Q98_000034 [Chlorella vulgaris]